MSFNDFIQEKVIKGRKALACTNCRGTELNVLYDIDEIEGAWFALICPRCKRLMIDLNVTAHFSEDEYMESYRYFKEHPDDSDEDTLLAIIDGLRRKKA